MATWEDGPEYAPIHRPDGFQVPEVAPLDQAPARHHLSAGAPLVRPQFSHPEASLRPLESLVPAPGDTRNPAEPFAVAASTITSTDSAWSAAHWSPPTGPPVAPAQNWGPPTTVPAGVPAPLEHGSYPSAPAGPDPNVPIHLHDQAPPPPGGFPAPGTPQWFAPTGPPPVQHPPQNGSLDPKKFFAALTPALVIVLGIGTLFAALAPVFLFVGFGLSTRVTVAADKVRKVFIGAAIFWGVAGPLLGFVQQPGSIGGWYDWVGGAAQIACLAALLGTALVIYLEFTRGPNGPAGPNGSDGPVGPPTAPPRQPWG